MGTESAAAAGTSGEAPPNATASDRRGDGRSSLIGGDADLRARTSKVPPVDDPHVLAPRRREGDLAKLDAFVADRPLHVEVGFGRPHHLCDLAAARPDARVLGFEVRRRWIHDAGRRATREGLDHLRVVEGDVRTFVQWLPVGGVDAFYVLFPDPWWKKRHHKRRIIRPDFVEAMYRRLTPGGQLVVKTDVPAYAELIEEVILDELPHRLERRAWAGAGAGFDLAGTSYADPELGALPRSHREKKCAELGIPVFQFRFVKRAAVGGALASAPDASPPATSTVGAIAVSSHPPGPSEEDADE